MAKVHLRADKAGKIATCAAQPGRETGKVRFNSRRSYRTMASVIVSRPDFAATPAKDRCAHCMDMGLTLRNYARRQQGLPPLAHLFEGVA